MNVAPRPLTNTELLQQALEVISDLYAHEGSEDFSKHTVEYMNKTVNLIQARLAEHRKTIGPMFTDDELAMTVSAQGAYMGHAIPIKVCLHIADCIRRWYDPMPEAIYEEH